MNHNLGKKVELFQQYFGGWLQRTELDPPVPAEHHADCTLCSTRKGCFRNLAVVSAVSCDLEIDHIKAEW